MRGIITNLSAGGCVIETSEDVEQGKYIIIAFQIGSNFIQGIQGRLVRLKAAVSTTEDNFGKARKLVRECIVSFNEISQEHEHIIVDFVMSSQKQFESNLGLLE
jgi:DNA relaxase NicK